MSLDQEFQKRKPWTTQFVIDGKAYGGKFDFMSDPRIEQFRAFAPDAARILELGSLEGAHTFALAKLAGVESVTGLEGRDQNLEKAAFVQNLLQITNVTFKKANFERDLLTSFGTFDAVFCVGVLYHLPNPWFLVEQIAHIAPRLFLWTHYSPDKNANKVIEGFRGRQYKEFGLRDPLSGLSAWSFWLTYDSLLDMLRQFGFEHIQVLHDDRTHRHGSSVTLTAEKRQ